MSPDTERSLMWSALKRMARHLRVSTNTAGGWMARVSTPISRQAHDDDGSLMSAAHEEWARVVRVRQALDASGPIAQGIVGQRLAGIELSGIWHILVEACKDIALYYGGSVVAGAAVGGVAGFFVGGVGAVPGVAGGAAVGAQVGAWVLALLGLKSLVEYLGSAFRMLCGAMKGALGKRGDPACTRGTAMPRRHVATCTPPPVISPKDMSSSSPRCLRRWWPT